MFFVILYTNYAYTKKNSQFIFSLRMFQCYHHQFEVLCFSHEKEQGKVLFLGTSLLSTNFKLIYLALHLLKCRTRTGIALVEVRILTLKGRREHGLQSLRSQVIVASNPLVWEINTSGPDFWLCFSYGGQPDEQDFRLGGRKKHAFPVWWGVFSSYDLLSICILMEYI